MDAVKFLEERKRMFKNGKPIPNLDIDITYDSEKAVKFVEAWSVAHPLRTRQDVFLEQWPETVVDDGVLQIDPCVVSATHRNKHGGCAFMKRKCTDCRREFWTKEVE